MIKINNILGLIVEGFVIILIIVTTINIHKNTRGFFYELLSSVVFCILLMSITLRCYGYINETIFRILEYITCTTISFLFFLRKLFNKKKK